jgi:hypothetical protein
MSDFPTSEQAEEDRSASAHATRQLGLDYPLRFTSPAERVRMFRAAAQPYYDLLVRVHSISPRAPLMIRRASDTGFDIEPATLPEDLARIAAKIEGWIADLRKLYLAGLTS